MLEPISVRAVLFDKAFLLRMSLADFVRFSELAGLSGRSFAAWCREALLEKAKRECGERGVSVSGQNRVRVPLTPGRVVREPGVSGGVGRLVSSAEADGLRLRARDLAQRSGKCTADVERGVRCRLCGMMH